MDLSGLQETISTRGKIFPARSRMVGSVSGKSIMVPRIKPFGRGANSAHPITFPSQRGKAQQGGLGKACAASGQFQCCTSLIMSPSGLVRNVPYTVTSRGGPVEEDSDEHEGTSAGRGNGAGEEQDAAVDRCGKDTGVELPADEETLEAVSRGRSEGSAAPQCGKRFEPCEAGRVPAEGSAADPEEVFGNGAGAIWTDTGSGALSG